VEFTAREPVPLTQAADGDRGAERGLGRGARGSRGMFFAEHWNTDEVVLAIYVK
jgi:hypothetical protein